MNKFIPLMNPLLTEEDIDAVVGVLRSGMLVQGDQVASLEKQLCAFTLSPAAVAVSNGTATLHLALVVSGIGPGDEVIVPAFSYVATANVVELVGATPVFVDVDLRFFNIDVKKIEEKITSKTKAIIPVHEFGLACDIHEVKKIADKHKLLVIEDAACALGAKDQGVYTGTVGDFGSFSFHPRKAITAGEGGVIFAKSEAQALKLKALRNHGMEIVNQKMEFPYAGFNYRMTDFQAALILSQLVRLRAQIEYKQKLAEVYYQEIKSSRVILPQFDERNKNHTWQTFHVLVEDADRDELITLLRKEGIGTNYGAQCIPDVTYYKNKYQHQSETLFPSAYKSYKQGLALPIYERLTKEDVKYVSATLNKLLNN